MRRAKTYRSLLEFALHLCERWTECYVGTDRLDEEGRNGITLYLLPVIAENCWG
jgi:hypothetical protein